MPVGVAAARRDAVVLNGVLLPTSNGRAYCHATRAKRSLERGHRSIPLPREPSVVRNLKNIQTSCQTAPTEIGNRTAGTRGARSRPCASTRVVDAARGIVQNGDS